MNAGTFTRGARGNAGFTLVELLVVMLIIGVLAAIAVPSFYNQTDKAKDAQAKQAAGTAHTAMEVAARNNNGAYTGITAEDLVAEEQTLSGIALIEPVTTTNSFTVSVSSSTGNTFSISRAASGRLDFECGGHGTGGCPEDGNWGD
jgi:prepilin-type N-terminal cleavage/methylation domain-containing protein